MKKRERAQYFQRHPDKVPQHDKRGGYDPGQHRQIDANGQRYAQLMVEIQELRNQLATSQRQGSPVPKAQRSPSGNGSPQPGMPWSPDQENTPVTPVTVYQKGTGCG